MQKEVIDVADINEEFSLPALPEERTQKAVSTHMAKHMPKKESEMMRQMRADYLSMPRKERSLKAIAEKYNYSYDWVYGISVKFGWLEDAKSRDSAIMNTFAEEHAKEIRKVQKLLLASLVRDVESLALTRGVKWDEAKDAIEDLNADEEAKVLEKINNIEFLKNAKNYQNILHMIESIRRVSFQFNPNAEESPGPKGTDGKRPVNIKTHQLVIMR